eukprot:m.137118 g.137118  ORF g.137118 m.137118 type:complete len:149 (-) comp11285_c0_seq1:99-545(-)
MDKRGLKRIVKKEIPDLMSGVDNFEDFKFNDDDISSFECVLVPSQKPFNQVKLSIKVTFPDKYPFQPPEVRFTKHIFHPNIIKEEGKMCFGLIAASSWKPTTSMRQILTEIETFISNPDVDNPLNGEATTLFKENQNEFAKKFIASAK